MPVDKPTVLHDCVTVAEIHVDGQQHFETEALCVQVNYRGSTGFGKSFLHAGDAEWGVGAMQNDLTDSVEWAVQQGIADPKRVAIFGGSYGQYLLPRRMPWS